MPILFSLGQKRMIHYTCDRCKSVIDPAQRTRYIVHVEVHSVEEPHQELGDSGDVDSLSLLHQMLEGIESKPITMNDCDGEMLDGDDAIAAALGVESRAVTLEHPAEIDPTDDVSDDDLPTHRAQYDLCPQCYRMYLRNPLGRDLSPVLQFSKN